jgi:hypothetical protein
MNGMRESPQETMDRLAGRTTAADYDATAYELLLDDDPKPGRTHPQESPSAADAYEDELDAFRRKRKGEWSARGLTADERARYDQWSRERQARHRAARERGVFTVYQSWMA